MWVLAMSVSVPRTLSSFLFYDLLDYVTHFSAFPLFCVCKELEIIFGFIVKLLQLNQNSKELAWKLYCIQCVCKNTSNKWN